MTTRIFNSLYLKIKINAVTITGIISIVIGTLVLTGWIYGIVSLQTMVPKYASMKFNTALEFVLLGTLLLLTQIHKKNLNIILLLLSLLIIAISGISLSQTVFNFDTGLDQLFITDPAVISSHSPHAGRMASNTALCFILLALSLAGFHLKWNIFHIISQYLMNIVTAIAAVALIGYLYGEPSFYNESLTGSMAVHTALLFFFISLSASLLNSALGITGLFTGKRVGNTFARRLGLIGVLVIVILGIVSLKSRQYTLFSFGHGFPILIICFVAAGFGLIWHFVRWLNSVDESRTAAENEVKQMNDELEKKVKERSAKLIALIVKLRESESKFKASFEKSAIGMALVSLKGKWMQVNKPLCDMIGYKEQELLTMSFMDITHPDDNEIYGGLVTEILASESHTGKIEKRYICKNGAVVWISINIATVTNKKGGALYFVNQFEDVTDRKKAEAELQSAYREIKKHVRNIHDIAWKQSHLVRRPLANLKGLATLLEDDPGDSKVIQLVRMELNQLDKVIVEMAEDVASQGVKLIKVQQRSFKIIPQVLTGFSAGDDPVQVLAV